MVERTLFFVKYRNVQNADRIFDYVRENLGNQKGFAIQNRKIVTPSEEMWMEFYEHLAEKYSPLLVRMAKGFSGKEVDIAVITGKDIIRRTKELVGPTLYKDNPSWTIRGREGPYDGFHTVVHASDRKEVERDLRIFAKYNFINP